MQPGARAPYRSSPNHTAGPAAPAGYKWVTSRLNWPSGVVSPGPMPSAPVRVAYTAPAPFR